MKRPKGHKKPYETYQGKFCLLYSRSGGISTGTGYFCISYLSPPPYYCYSFAVYRVIQLTDSYN